MMQKIFSLIGEIFSISLMLRQDNFNKMKACISILSLFLILVVSLHMNTTVNANEIEGFEEIKRLPAMGFAKRYPYKTFAFAKRSNDGAGDNYDDAIEDTLIDQEIKRSYPYRFAFAKRGYNSRFAFAKRSYPRGFAFA